MSVHARKLTDKSVVYWVSFRWHGKQVWEHAGKDKRAAQRLDAQRKKEVRDGTYTPEDEKASTSVRQWATSWLDKRTNRNAKDERRAVERYALSRSWFAEMALTDVRSMHAVRLVDELKPTVSERTGRPLEEKTIGNIYGTLHTCFLSAMHRGLVAGDVFKLPRNTLDKTTAAPRAPYDRDEAERLMTNDLIGFNRRVFNALAFLTGMREGEICGRRFRDWIRDARPLTALRVHTQYNDQPLKTAKKVGRRPRIVPVHPILQRILETWWAEGWKLIYGRDPTQDDFIVPRVPPGPNGSRVNIGRAGAYEAWVDSCDKAGVPNRTLHATRHTFISFCRRGDARKDVVEKITHNAKGDIVDTYTHLDWAPLCRAVLCWGVEPAVYPPGDDPSTKAFLAAASVTPPGLEAGETVTTPRNTSQHSPTGGGGDLARNRINATPAAAVVDAGKQIPGPIAFGVSECGAGLVVLETLDGQHLGETRIEPGDSSADVARHLAASVRDRAPIKVRAEGSAVRVLRGVR